MPDEKQAPDINAVASNGSPDAENHDDSCPATLHGDRPTGADAGDAPATPKGGSRRKPIRYKASIYTPAGHLPPKFASLVREMESVLHAPIWLLVQNGEGPYRNIDHFVYKGFRSQASSIEEGKRACLLIESSGGDAHFAYRIARLFQRRTHDFVVVVPSWAKSAATLLALGAAELIMGRDAELGPIDVQMLDRDREDFGSALDAVQALERLNAFSLTALDQTMQLLIRRTGKKIDSILPHVLDYVTRFVRPLLQKIDTVDYTKKSRELKVAEEYATRLMRPFYDDAAAISIASKLVEKYPTHGFVIDDEEARSEGQGSANFGTGLRIADPPDGFTPLMESLIPFLDEITAIGRIEEIAA